MYKTTKSSLFEQIDLEGSNGNSSNGKSSNRTNGRDVHDSSRGRSGSSSRSDGRGSLAGNGADTRSSRADDGADSRVKSDDSLGLSRGSEGKGNSDEFVHLFGLIAIVAGDPALFILPLPTWRDSCMATPKKEIILGSKHYYGHIVSRSFEIQVFYFLLIYGKLC